MVEPEVRFRPAAAAIATVIVCICEPDTEQIYATSRTRTRQNVTLLMHGTPEADEMIRLAATALGRVGWSPEPETSSHHRADADEMAKRHQRIIDVLDAADGPLTAVEIITEAGIPVGRRSDIYRYLGKLMNIGTVVRSGSGKPHDPYRYTTTNHS